MHNTGDKIQLTSFLSDIGFFLSSSTLVHSHTTNRHLESADIPFSLKNIATELDRLKFEQSTQPNQPKFDRFNCQKLKTFQEFMEKHGHRGDREAEVVSE